jgi:hypothetical protein
MFSATDTLSLQRMAILIATLVGLACCILAVLDARAQQAAERAAALPALATPIGYARAHHMHGSLSRTGTLVSRVRSSSLYRLGGL